MNSESVEEPKKTLILCGMKGAGKSFYAGRLAAHGIKCFDSDRAILLSSPFPSIRELYLASGEQKFRQLECAALRSIFSDIAKSPFKRFCIATGGGLADNAAALNLINRKRSSKRLAITAVCLAPDEQTLWQRASSIGLPGYLHGTDSKEQFLAIAKKRKNAYLNFCDFVIQLPDYGSEEETVERLLRLF